MAHAFPETVVSHWSTLVDGLQTSPLDFYSSVMTAIERRQIPEASTERIEYKEGGALSAHRVYLRVKRSTYVFDICAAPFGRGFFFSTWLAKVPILNGLHKLLILGGLFVLFFFLLSRSFWFGPLWFAALLLFVLFLMSKGEAELDEAIMELPGLGWLYVRLFKPITYFRIDTALMFQDAVHAAVVECLDELTSAKGLRSLTELERKPALKAYSQKA